MIFFLTTLDAYGNVRDFSCAPIRLEDGFDFLSTVVAMGDTLLEVRLVDGDTETALPLAVFDGAAFREPMQKLAKEWQTVLSAPARSAVTFDKTWLIAWNQERIRLCEASIQSQQLMIYRLSRLIERNEATSRDSANRAAFARWYQAQLTTYQAQLQQSTLQRGQIVRRLSALTYL